MSCLKRWHVNETLLYMLSVFDLSLINVMIEANRMPSEEEHIGEGGRLSSII